VKQNILIIDDEPAIQNLITTYFSAHGYPVTSAENGSDGLRLLNERPFHVVILDLVFPKEDGLELLTEVKKTHPKLPVIILTGVGYDEEILREAVDRKASGYVSKGLPMEQLLMEVRRVLKPETLKL
jgi:DNA-binding NtrC family response regulator